MKRASLAEWLNTSLLPEGTSTTENHGLCAGLYSDGQLKRFGHFNQGTAIGWVLELEQGIEEGKALIEAGSGGTPDYEVYKGGMAERYDAWSDNSPAKPSDFRKWVESWIESIDSAAKNAVRQQEVATQVKAKIQKDGMRSVIKVVRKRTE